MPIGRTLLPIAIIGTGSLQAEFTVNLTTIEPSDTVQFTDLTTDITPTSWEWDFGDGEKSTLQNPTHRYKFSGQFTVTLKASDGVTTVFEEKQTYIDCSSPSCIITIDTRRNDGLNTNNQFRYVRPAVGGTTDIDWGDGNTDTISGANVGITHTYATPGIYKVKFDSATFGMPSQLTRDKIIEFNNWGSGVTYWQSGNLLRNVVGSMYATDFPGVFPNLVSIFQDFAGFIREDIFSNWPTTVLAFSQTNNFVGNVHWNGDVSKLVLDNAVTPSMNLFRMFESNATFNQDLSHWFQTPPLPGATVNFHLMFQGCNTFNQDISGWDVSAGVAFNSMFENAFNFNQDLSGWDVSNATNLGQMFRFARSFTSDLSSWNTSNATSLVGMFNGAISFNSDISSWDVSNVTNLGQMFRFARSFTSDLSSWNTSNATSLVGMFNGAISFNSDISSWDVSNVTNFLSMFWDASSFNQNLGPWQLRTAGVYLQNIFRDSGMSTENYTDTIVGWANYVFDNSGPLNVNMTAQGGMTFTNSRPGGANFSDAQAARVYLATQGWSITGDTVVA